MTRGRRFSMDSLAGVKPRSGKIAIAQMINEP
jgi:hypothetical protein